MSLRKCEKLIAARILKRVPSARAAGSSPRALGSALAPRGGFLAALTLSDIALCPWLVSWSLTLLASSSHVLRECGDEALRAVRLPQGASLALGRARLHRRHRSHSVPRRSRARPVR